jgi:hypothetical protein
MDPEAMQRFAAMREAMTELTQSAEQALGAIVGRNGLARLHQIQLQLDGPTALARPDMAEKLNMDEAQVEQIQELMSERRQAQGETRKARGEIMKAAFASIPRPNADDNGQNGNNGQIRANGQNGGNRGNRNRFNDPAFQEAMKKYMETPEVKAKMEQFQSQDERIANQFAAAVNRVLTKRQAATYKKMLGAPFDLSKIRPGPGQGFFGRNAAAKGAGAKNQVSTTKPVSADSDDSDAAKPAPAKSGATASPSTAKPKRKSLRDLRGLGSDDP